MGYTPVSVYRPVSPWLSRPFLRNTPPSALLPWLLDSGSLTARLQQHSQGDFAVRLLRQYWGVPRRDEAEQLGLCQRQVALIREVILQGKQQPWVFARSILPDSSLTGQLRHLRWLDNRPLGALLFRYPHLQRHPIQVARFTSASTMGAEFHAADCLWGRRSTFFIDDKPLLVAEVFLPAFVDSLNPLV